MGVSVRDVRLLTVTGSLILAASCASGGEASPTTTERPGADNTPGTTTPTSAVADGEPEPGDRDPSSEAPTVAPRSNVIDVPDAIAINVATNGSDDPVIGWTSRDAVRVARLDLGPLGLGPPLVVSGDLEPVGHPIERPALSIGADGVVHVAFTSFVGANGSVFYVDLRDDRPTQPALISGPPRPETNLVHMTLGDDAPALAWLEDSTLSVAPPADAGPREVENVDDLTCDCCNPVPVRFGDQLTVAYRDQERTDDGIVRDVFAITSADGGLTFGAPVRVADEHWFLDGCPFSGPSVVRTGDDLVVTWMDARQSLHPDQDETTIWVDRSTDGGATFGTDLAITDGGIHRWSSLVVDVRGVVHLVWETQSIDGGISYSSSDDGGAHFGPPTVLVPNTPESGSRRAPSAVAHGEHLIVTWVDRAGGHVTSFAIDALPS